MKIFRKTGNEFVTGKTSPFKIVDNEKSIFLNCTICNSSVVSTTYGERLDTGWNNVNFVSVLSKEWCPVEFKGQTTTFYEKLRVIIEGNNIVHFPCTSYVKLLQEDNLNGNSVLPFLANIVDNRH